MILEIPANFLGNAALVLFQHPGELDCPRTDPAYIPPVLDELLRFDSHISTATFRFTTEAVTLGGTDIPVGVPVLTGEPRRPSC